MDAIKLDSTVQQLVVSIQPPSIDNTPPSIEYNDAYREIIHLVIEPNRVGRIKVFYCSNPYHYVDSRGASSDGVTLSPETPWVELTGQVAKIFHIYDWFYHTTGRNSDIKQFRVAGFKTDQTTILFNAHIWTATNRYAITARIPLSAPPEATDGAGFESSDTDESYLGVTMSSRTPRLGEDWTRGNDLTDGNFTLHTWTRAAFDILGSELQTVHTRYIYGIKSSPSNREFPYGRDGMIRIDPKDNEWRWYNP